MLLDTINKHSDKSENLVRNHSWSFTNDGFVFFKWIIFWSITYERYAE